jgi:uncharacterized integral membrane protein (TIGR00698 family)
MAFLLSEPLSPTLATDPAREGGVRQDLGRRLQVVPGVLLCIAITLAARALQGLETAVLGKAWLESLVLAILLGAIVRTVWTPAARWRPGVQFSAKLLLEVAVVLLGASVSASTLLAAGPGLLLGIAGVVAIALTASYGIGRLFGLPPRMATLVACGNSICGNSAIAAVAPVIEACGEDVASAIAFTAVLGVIAVLGLPLIGVLLHMDELRYGALAGLTVYAVPQVLAATASVGATAVQIGTLVKLVRVLMLGPVCLGLSLIMGRPGVAGASRIGTQGLKLTRLVPWFIIGFMALMAARSMGAVPIAALKPISQAAGILTVVSMAALGLTTDLRTVVKAGARVSLAVTLSLLVLGAISLGLISLLRMA